MTNKTKPDEVDLIALAMGLSRDEIEVSMQGLAIEQALQSLQPVWEQEIGKAIFNSAGLEWPGQKK